MPVCEVVVPFPHQVWLSSPHKLVATLPLISVALLSEFLKCLGFCMLLPRGSILTLTMCCQLSPDFEEVNLVKGTLSTSVHYTRLSIQIPLVVLQFLPLLLPTLHSLMIVGVTQCHCCTYNTSSSPDHIKGSCLV